MIYSRAYGKSKVLAATSFGADPNASHLPWNDPLLWYFNIHLRFTNLFFTGNIGLLCRSDTLGSSSLGTGLYGTDPHLLMDITGKIFSIRCNLHEPQTIRQSFFHSFFPAPYFCLASINLKFKALIILAIIV
jgi:hypothetical protein